MRTILATAIASSLITLGVVKLMGAKTDYSEKTLLDNKRATVTERVMEVNSARDPHTRATDQIIVFLNDTAYDRVDPQSGKIERRTRKAGDILWHDKGEHAPKLINRGAGPMRSLVIALK